MRLFLEDVWKPFEEAGYPEERWPEVRASLDQLRPLSPQALVAVYQMTMSDEVDEGLRQAARANGQTQGLAGPGQPLEQDRKRLVLLAGGAGEADLAGAVAGEMGVELAALELGRPALRRRLGQLRVG